MGLNEYMSLGVYLSQGETYIFVQDYCVRKHNNFNIYKFVGL